MSSLTSSSSSSSSLSSSPSLAPLPTKSSPPPPPPESQIQRLHVPKVLSEVSGTQTQQKANTLKQSMFNRQREIFTPPKQRKVTQTLKNQSDSTSVYNNSPTDSPDSLSRDISPYSPFHETTLHNALLRLQKTQEQQLQEQKGYFSIEPNDNYASELPFFREDRYEEYDKCIEKSEEVAEWRYKKKKRTLFGLLLLCLNIGVDPPDVVKVHPCSVLECWEDPFKLMESTSSSQALQKIGNKLEEQYKKLQPNAKYHQCLAPSAEHIQRIATKMRKHARADRILFHYNGHGVPKPTSAGEIWVFNNEHTQYIPLPLNELEAWQGFPTFYILDCANAGNAYRAIVEMWETSQDSRKEHGYILAACQEGELPTNPAYPSDLFTSCLTTPILMALHWFCYKNKLLDGITMKDAKEVPGSLTDKRSPLGELNWIFTTVTDSIAWSILPRDLFQKLFRQDIMVASLFRNFLLADRIMKTLNCSPISYPQLPSTHNHPLWKALDFAIDSCLSQVSKLRNNPTAIYEGSSFFTHQLTEFEIWLNLGARKKKFPNQLPVLLQVLLTAVHRLRALQLLGRFIDLGPWAVNLCLSVGIVPYILKSLVIESTELRYILTFIWSKIIAFDRSCREELVVDNAHVYFINVLENVSNDSNLRMLAAFTISSICYKYKAGQTACYNYKNLLKICHSQLDDQDAQLRKWLCFTIANLIADYEQAQVQALKIDLHEKLIHLLSDPDCNVRAASVFALQKFIGKYAQKSEQRIKWELNIGSKLYKVVSDGNELVKRELILGFYSFINCYSLFSDPQMICRVLKEGDDAYTQMKQLRSSNYSLHRQSPSNVPSSPVYGKSQIRSSHSHHSKSMGRRACFVLDICRIVKVLGNDPSPSVSNESKELESYILEHFTPEGEGKTSENETKVGESKLFLYHTKQFFKPIMPENVENLGETFMRETSHSIIRSPSQQEIASVFPLRYQLEKLKEKRQKEAIYLINNMPKKRISEQIAILGTDSRIPHKISFFAYDPVLVMCSDSDVVSVWQWFKNNKKLNEFKVSSTLGGRITDMQLIGDPFDPLMMLGSDSGSVNILKGIRESERLVSAFNAAPDAKKMKCSPGMLLKWNEWNRLLYVAGASKHIKIWDLQRELCVQSISSDDKATVTTLSSHPSDTYTIATGYDNGNIHVYDRRQNSISRPTHSLVHSIHCEKSHYILNTTMRKADPEILISGCINGEIKLWDLRMGKVMKTYDNHSNSITSMSVHDYAPIVATGGNNQCIKFTHLKSGDVMNTIYYHESFLGQRIGPVSSLCFHPYRLCLAVGHTDFICSVYTGDHALLKKIKN